MLVFLRLRVRTFVRRRLTLVLVRPLASLIFPVLGRRPGFSLVWGVIFPPGFPTLLRLVLLRPRRCAIFSVRIFMPKVALRAPHNYDYAAASDESALRCEDVSLAKQSFKEECDINTIVDRFGIGYDMPQGLVAPAYGDFLGVTDFQSAMNAIAGARESFDALHADVRARFVNDPHQFVEFCLDPANRAEVERFGLIVKPEAPAAVPAPPAPAGPVSGPAGPIPT